MKRILCYFSVVLIAIIMASCESGKKFNSHGFEGEYKMCTELYSPDPNGDVLIAPRAYISPVSMYVENNHLYIRTNWFGMPNTGDEDTGIVEYTVDPPYESLAPAVDEDNEDGDNEGGSGIEVVPDNPQPIIVMMNGFVWVMKSGNYVKSLPIQALDVKEDRILFKNSDKFDVEVTDESGTQLATWRLHYEYGPAVLRNDTIFWDVTKIVDSGVNFNGGTLQDLNIKYKNYLIRK